MTFTDPCQPPRSVLPFLLVIRHVLPYVLIVLTLEAALGLAGLWATALPGA